MLVDVQHVDVACAGGVSLACERAHERCVLEPGPDEQVLPLPNVRAHVHGDGGIALEALV